MRDSLSVPAGIKVEQVGDADDAELPADREAAEVAVRHHDAGRDDECGWHDGLDQRELERLDVRLEDIRLRHPGGGECRGRRLGAVPAAAQRREDAGTDQKLREERPAGERRRTFRDSCLKPPAKMFCRFLSA
ncbi:hypothetical protein ABSL23_16475 (plasmid) [Halobacterium sp. NMX12-1]|uniref:Uncharacterized protein n=1 Tax=Halobacterium sp. NMX12-1 TaxID=3166650 RepID=A0AAU8CGP1_9EURY